MADGLRLIIESMNTVCSQRSAMRQNEHESSIIRVHYSSRRRRCRRCCCFHKVSFIVIVFVHLLVLTSHPNNNGNYSSFVRAQEEFEKQVDEDNDYDDNENDHNTNTGTDNEAPSLPPATTVKNNEAAQQIDELRNLVEVKFEGVNATLLGTLDATEASSLVMDVIGAKLRERIAGIFAKAKTAECRQKIAKHFGYFVNAIGLEESLPFTDIAFPNECGEPVYIWKDLPEDVNPGDIQNRTYQPPRNETEYIDDPANLKLAYGIMTHDNPTATMRLIDTLHEQGHVFIIHVDGKEVHDDTHAQLVQYATTRPYVHVLNHPYRVRVNWGGFSMVNATLQILRYAFAVNSSNPEPLDFHKFVHLSSSSYPLASNYEIRYRLANYPLDANFLNIIMQPVRPTNKVWHYFVECDDAVHRIYQLPAPHTATMNAELFTASQWFIASREFAHYLADPPPNSFVAAYLKYVEHVVVADESFFGTVLRHTVFCKKHHNSNFLHLQFDRWESELPAGKRDERKCPMPNPDHCGRSPTIMTVDYADILELSNELFARKFDDEVDSKVKDILDDWRAKRVRAIESGETIENVLKPKTIDYEGHGVLIVAKETVKDPMPLCLGLGLTGNAIFLTPCFHDWVPRTLGEDWETGAVVIEETKHHVRWQVGPCTSDGNAERLPSGRMNVTKGSYSPTGPRCMLKQMDGIRAGRCFDAQSDSIQPGGPTQVFPCWHKWYQFLSFGDGERAPLGSMYTTIPSHNVKQIRNLGHEQDSYMCLGVYDRGSKDEPYWNDAEYTAHKKRSASEPQPTLMEGSKNPPAPLSEWSGEDIVTTRCDNMHGVIEWVFVPYIVEDEDEKEGDNDDRNDNGSESNRTTETEQADKDTKDDHTNHRDDEL